MKIARFRRDGVIGIGLVEGSSLTVLDLDAETGVGTILRLADGEARLRDAARLASVPLSAVELLAPIDDPRKIVAIGLNYVDHAGEGDVALPVEPLVFAKFPSSIVGPGAAIQLDSRLTAAVDLEAELAVVIGRHGRNVSRERALAHVFGYMCLNDVTARDLQFGDGQWVRGKSLDTFCPIGPWIVTADEVPNPNGLAISSTVNGEIFQAATTADMCFAVEELIVRLSRAFTLEPGDIIATGTPAGVGWFRNPRRLLRDGDVVVVSIEGIGELSNPVVASPPQPERE